MTKTVIIWDVVRKESIRFAVVDGDYRHLNNTYGNSFDKHANELDKLAFDDDGKCLLNLQDDFPVDAVKEGAFVIVAGLLP